MKAIVKRVGKPPVVEEVENTLEALQRLVDGYIETVTIFDDCCVICDEEALLKDTKRYNCTVLGLQLFGDIAVVGVDGDEFCDAPPLERIEQIHLFKYWGV